MSSYAVRIPRLTCDHPGCGVEIEGEPNTTNTKVRALAKRSGWFYRPGHPATGTNADFCPAHAAAARGDR